MIGVRARRLRRRRGEAGFSLIEVLVAIAVTSASVVTLVGAIAAVEKDTGVATSQAHVDLALRTVADELRSNDQIAYQTCANSSTYQGQVGQAGFTVTLAVERPVGGAMAPLDAGCGDYGVQRITITVASSASQASRIIWKSFDGSGNGNAHPGHGNGNGGGNEGRGDGNGGGGG